MEDHSLATPGKRCSEIIFRSQGSVGGITYHLETRYDAASSILTVCQMGIHGSGPLTTVLRLISTLLNQLASLSPKEPTRGELWGDLNPYTTGGDTSNRLICGCLIGSPRCEACRNWQRIT